MTILDESSGRDREVVDLKVVYRCLRTNKPLTDDEIGRLRKMLEAFDLISSSGGCPVAFRLLHGRTHP